MTFVTYAQNFEDVILARAFRDVEKGFYIDVGANDPIQDSVTKAFYTAGWRGLNIEPVTHWHTLLGADRPEDINLNVAAGAADGEIAFFDIPGTGLSTTVPSIAQQHAEADGRDVVEYVVPVRTLADICQEHAPDDIHFLKIDVEGGETQVLEGADFSRFRPWVVVIESTLPNTQQETRDQWEHLLVAGNYVSAHFDGLNRFYVAKEHAHLCDCFKLPPNFFDDFVLHSNHYYSTLARQQGDAEVALLEERITQQSHEHEQSTEVRFGQLDVLVSELEQRIESVRLSEAKLSEHVSASGSEAAEFHENLVNRLQELQEHAERADARADRADARADFLQESVEQLQIECNNLSQSNAALQSALTQSEKQTKRALRLSVDAARKAAAALTSERKRHIEVEEGQLEVGRLKENLKEREDALAQSSAQLSQLEKDAGQISRELQDAHLQIADLNRHSHHWHTVAGANSAELDRVYGSLSWRLTSPLRKLNAPFVRSKAGRTIPPAAPPAAVNAPLQPSDPEPAASVTGTPAVQEDAVTTNDAPSAAGRSRSAVLQRRLAKAISTER